MTRRNGLLVSTAKLGNGKEWLIVRTPPEGAPPSFEDWYLQIAWVGVLEVQKYGGDPYNVDDWYRLTKMPRRFFWDCMEHRVTYPQLRKRYGLPR